MVTIISLKKLYYTLQEEGIALGSLNAQSFVVLEPSCVAKCMAGLNDNTDSRQAFSEHECGDEYKLLKLQPCVDVRGKIAGLKKCVLASQSVYTCV